MGSVVAFYSYGPIKLVGWFPGRVRVASPLYEVFKAAALFIKAGI